MYRLMPSVRLRRGPELSYWVFCLETGEHFEVNETAFKVIDAVGRELGPELIATELAVEYGLETATVEADVIELLEACVKQGLVTTGRNSG